MNTRTALHSIWPGLLGGKARPGQGLSGPLVPPHGGLQSEEQEARSSLVLLPAPPAPGALQEAFDELGLSAEKIGVHKLTGGHHALRQVQAEGQRGAGRGGHHRG